VTVAPVVLGLESSCDETAAAIVRGPDEVLASVVWSQHDLHERYAGVVPEIASRAHLERLLPVLDETLASAGLGLDAGDAIAVGHRPGRIGSLLVALSAAKALAWSLGRSLVGVDHVLAHLHAPVLRDPGEPARPIAWPALGLVVSGGHTSLLRLTGATTTERLGRTIDDAVGEAFDKVASILGLGFPGGPAVDRLAATGRDDAHDLPVASLGRDEDGGRRLDFSFSGLKTAVLYAARGHPVGRGAGATFPRDGTTLPEPEKADLAASFQRAAIRAITRNLERAIDRHEDTRSLVVGGGVAANTRLRAELAGLAEARGVELRVPPMRYCLDNAAMIAGLGAVRLVAGATDDLGLAAATSSEIA